MIDLARVLLHSRRGVLSGIDRESSIMILMQIIKIKIAPVEPKMQHGGCSRPFNED